MTESAPGNGPTSQPEIHLPDVQQSIEAYAASQPPLVTAVMAISDPRRLKLAVRAINQFGNQSYDNKQLLVINSSGKRITNRNHPIVQEIEVDPAQYPTVGALRNLGIQQSEAEWILPWDDDNHSHPHRIALQMAHRREGSCVVLSHEIRLDVQMASPETHCVCVCEEPEGIPGTILFPRSVVWAGSATPPLYDDLLSGPGEDVALLRQFGERKIVLHNGYGFPGPMLHLAFYQGLNLKSRGEFFGRFAGAEFYQHRDLAVSGDRLDYLVHVMRQYGYDIHEEQRVNPAPGAGS